MSKGSLDSLLESAGGPVNLLRGSKVRRSKSPLLAPWHTMPPLVPSEFCGVIGEARAYRDAVAIVDLTHHMTDVSISGPDAIEFLNLHGTDIKVGTYPARALLQNFTNSPTEIWGPFENRDEVRAILMEAGEDLGVQFSGSGAHKQLPIETGWWPHPLPAIYTGAGMKAYREWLPDDGPEALVPLKGSFYSENIEDYYLTPYEVGCGKLVKFTHDFIGSEALRKMDPASRRKRVILAWDSDDVADVLSKLVHRGGEQYRFMDLQDGSRLFRSTYDTLWREGRVVGLSHESGFNTNERRYLSVACVDQDLNEGDEVVLDWGEAGGGSGTFAVAPTKMARIRATVSPVPYPLNS